MATLRNGSMDSNPREAAEFATTWAGSDRPNSGEFGYNGAAIFALLCGTLLSLLLATPLTAQTPSEGTATKQGTADEDPPEQRPADGTGSVPAALGEPAAEENLLERAIHNMRSVQQRISARDPGDRTRQLQEQIVQDLQKLIELARQQQQSPNPSSASGVPQPQQQPQPENSEQPKQQPEQRQTDAGGDGERKQNDANSETADNLKTEEEEGRAAMIELDRRREIVKEVWGHLPPALRQEMLNVYSEKFLPKYDELVRRYFEALADDARTGNR